MKGLFINICFLILCFTVFLSLSVPPVRGDQKQTQPEGITLLDNQVALMHPMTGKVSKSEVRNFPLPIRLRDRERLYHPIIINVSEYFQVDPALVKAIILAESRYNPNAISHKGAKGLMQLMPNTARSLGVVDIFDPVHNITGGVKYFKELLNKFEGDIKLALAAYNAGSRKVYKYKGIPPFKTTKRYIKNVFNYYETYKQQM